ncbi:hypothetical protein ACFS6H_05960 [Terrimonas rubra]|uniref:Uncharacterized protein n=1 Tax=Terrimonas rubra TaxID=1035890 RepID=A0ABW6A1Y0_9BACT
MLTEKKKLPKWYKPTLICLVVIIVFIIVLPEPDKPALPEYNIFETNKGDSHSSYRINVGDSLPNQEQAVGILDKIAEDDPALKVDVFIYRKGFQKNSGADARVSKSESEKTYTILSTDNSTLQKAAGYTFDSIPGKKELFAGLSNMGSKILFYELENGKFIKVFISSPGSYFVDEIIKDPASGGDIDRFIFKDGAESFIYDVDKTNKIIKITNQDGDAVDVHKLL